MRNASLLIILNFLFSSLSAQFADRSVLADGTIYALGVEKSGVYKITYNFLGNNGVNPASVIPSTVKIFGQGGGMLAQSNAETRVDDLQELPIQIVGGDDGSFDPDDYILFYAEGANSYYFDEDDARFKHVQNLYDDINYYFLKLDATGVGLRIGNQLSEPVAGNVVNTFDDFVFEEPELNNILGSGRDWYGKEYKFTLNESFSLPMSGIVDNSSIKVDVAVMTRSTENSSFSVEFNGQVIGDVSSGITPISTYGWQGSKAEQSFILNSSGLNTDAGISIDLTYNQPNINARGYLDYILINAKRALKLYDGQTRFRSIESISNTLSEFQVQDIPATGQIWDITNPLAYSNQEFQLTGATASFKVNTFSQLKEFVVFDPIQLNTPAQIIGVANQDLHGLDVPNLLIVTPVGFKPEAERLAAFRRQFDGLTVQVVELPQIYREFSSGRQDITAIRDFVRMLYLKSTDAAHTLKYVLLFGDASYDYRGRLTKNTNQIPVYESRNSLHPVLSYSSDDYFGFLETAEGYWEETGASINSHTLEVGVGRLPINTLNEAKVQVDKLIHYSQSTSTLGKWRKDLTFVADDGDFNTHQRDADELAEIVDENYKNFNSDRVFVDAFPQVSQGITKQSAEGREAVRKAGQEGVLIMNFTGHGAESGWTSEGILDHSLINEWTNLDNMPLFVTATCQFGRYDNPDRESGAEVAIRSAEGGCIGLLTTTRPVLSFSNFKVNQAFYGAVFERIDGEMPRLGDVIRVTKNNSLNGVNNRNFSLLGDPSMRLAYPKDDVVVTSIKREDGTVVNTLRALDKITITGEVRQDGTIASSFNGVLDMTVFEKPASITTLGDDGPSTKMTFKNQQNKIFEGKTTINNGQFEFSFVVPMDINYELGDSKISLYAQHESEVWDAAGYHDVQVGSSNNDAIADVTAPEVSLFLENEDFEDGGIVPRQPIVFANIADISGLNLTGLGVGHNIQVVIDDLDELTFDASDAFQYDLGSFTNGKLRFQIPTQLEPGEHQLKLTVFDSYNNGISKEVTFQVTSLLTIEGLINYPNPFKESTQFSFTHNREGDELKVSIQIYSTLGELMAVIDREFINSSGLINSIAWDGTGDSGFKLSSGLYIYKVVVQSKQDKALGVSVGRLYVDR